MIAETSNVSVNTVSSKVSGRTSDVRFRSKETRVGEVESY